MEQVYGTKKMYARNMQLAVMMIIWFYIYQKNYDKFEIYLLTAIFCSKVFFFTLSFSFAIMKKISVFAKKCSVYQNYFKKICQKEKNYA